MMEPFHVKRKRRALHVMFVSLATPARSLLAASSGSITRFDAGGGFWGGGQCGACYCYHNSLPPEQYWTSCRRGGRLHMGGTASDSDGGSDGRRRRVNYQGGGNGGKPSGKRKITKMKKMSPSSSKLLTPPNIALSGERQSGGSRRWATVSSDGTSKGNSKRSKPPMMSEPSFPSLSSFDDRISPPIPKNNAAKQKISTNKNVTKKKGKSNKSGVDGRGNDDLRPSAAPIPPFTSAKDATNFEERKNNSPASYLSSLSSDPADFVASIASPSPMTGHDFLSSTSLSSAAAAIDGVLPVSELFYRSTQSISTTEEQDRDGGTGKRGLGSKSGIKDELGDDEELPFSAEQSNQLSTTGNNKIRIRRNKANGSGATLDDLGIGMESGVAFPSEAVESQLLTMAEQEKEEQRRFKDQASRTPSINQQQRLVNSDPSVANGEKPRKKSNKSKRTNRNKNNGRKMVRRGMEMLVGGEPINADPPQRSVELSYFRKNPKYFARSITTNSPDFGPLLHIQSSSKVSREEVGLFCENFVSVARKWGICPNDLRAILPTAPMSDEDVTSLIETATLLPEDEKAGRGGDGSKNDDGQTKIFNSRELDAPKGFGAGVGKRKDISHRGGRSGIIGNGGVSEGSGQLQKEPSYNDDDGLVYTLGGELKFFLAMSRAELDSGRGAFSRVLRNGIGSSIDAEEMGFDVHIDKLVIHEKEGSADVDVSFQLQPNGREMDRSDAKRAATEISGALATAMDDGKMAMMLAHAAREEKGWPAKIRDRIVEEFLMETEDDDDEGDARDEEEDDVQESSSLDDIDDGDDDTNDGQEYDGPFGMEGDIIYAKDDIWLGGGNGGVFFDYSESNANNSPYKGMLGPMFVDAAVERARQNQPRVIAIGDVHGCIDELKALLKKCDYHPGDLVVFLGDLVCKGPDSLSVVQLAREIGAIGVRGNHDFEVVRWHQAIKSGADPPVIGSEHYYVATALDTADLKWLYSLPWFISSSHLNALFVHAGFVSGIRLAKQNPRLMMNMRSILPDGTVTSKFFNNWPWARLWDGPQTVFFGHDADRGLQQYEHAIGLDTGCVYGGKLTACILPDRRFVSVNAKREYFQYRRKHFD